MNVECMFPLYLSLCYSRNTTNMQLSRFPIFSLTRLLLLRGSTDGSHLQGRNSKACVKTGEERCQILVRDRLAESE